MFILNSMTTTTTKINKISPRVGGGQRNSQTIIQICWYKKYIILMNRLCTLALNGLKAPQGREVNEVSCQRAWLTCGQTVSGTWLASPETLTELTVGLTFRTPTPRNQLLSVTDVRITWLHWTFWGERKMTQQQQNNHNNSNNKKNKIAKVSRFLLDSAKKAIDVSINDRT